MSAQLLITRRAPLPAASFNRQTRTFTAVAATSAPVPRTDWNEGGIVNEVLVITPAAVDLSRLASGRAPILNGHRRGTAADQIGVIRAARIEGGELIIEGELSGRADLAGLADDLAAGITANVSVGYSVHARERVGGKAGQTDTVRVTRWEPVEVSIVPVPADPAAFIRSGVSSVEPDEIEGGAAVVTPPPATRPPSTETRAERNRINTIRDLAKSARMNDAELEAAIENGTTVHDFRIRAFNFAADEAKRTMTCSYSPDANYQDTRGGGDGIDGAISEALYARMSGKKAEGRARELMGRSLLELGQIHLESRGERTRWFSRDELAERIIGRGGAHTTSDFPGLLTNSSNRFLGDAYEAAGSPLKQLARRRTRTDFKDVTDLRLSEAPRLKPVGEKGEITHGTRAEESRPLYKMGTFSRMFSLSRNALINDDLNAFADSVAAFGQGAAETENDLLVGLFTANAGAGVLMFDGQPLYHSSHGNIGPATALSVDSLGVARLSLRLMKGLDGKTPINAVAKHLVVGPALETTAEKVLTQLAATKVDDVNPFPGRLQLHVEPRFEGSAWRLFADPAALPTIETSYLAGHEGPQITFREGWDTLGVEFRVVLDFGCGARDWRGTYYNPGA